MQLTQARLKELLHYDPETGVFTNKTNRGKKAYAQEEAGGVSDPRGYRTICIDNNNHGAHRLAFLYMIGRFPDDQVDHIDGVTSNNRFINLRQATNCENAKNRRIQVNSTSGFVGVNWYHGKWRVRIRSDGEAKYLGSFENLSDAVKARLDAEEKYGFHPNHGSMR